MLIPEIVTKETEYFIIVVFPENGNGETLKSGYKTMKTAKAAARRALVNSSSAKSAIIRHEDIFIRNEKAEISSSSPVIKYTISGGKISFSWLTKNRYKYMEA